MFRRGRRKLAIFRRFKAFLTILSVYIWIECLERPKTLKNKPLIFLPKRTICDVILLPLATLRGGGARTPRRGVI